MHLRKLIYSLLLAPLVALGGGTSSVMLAYGNVAPTDPFWASVVLLLQANTGTLIERTGLPNAINITGQGAVSTTQAKFGTHSFYNPGTTAQRTDYIQATGAAGLSLFIFPGQFTMEAWIYPVAFRETNQNLFTANNNTGNFYILPELQTSGANASPLKIISAAGGFQAGAMTPGAWYHVAITRDGSNLTRLYVNGTLVTSGTLTGTFGLDVGAGASQVFIFRGLNFSDNADFDTYADQIRITKGVARYTADFTPPTAPFPTQGP